MSALPVSPYAPGMLETLRRRQFGYIAVEKWRCRRALESLPAYERGKPMSVEERAAWAALGFWPMTVDELLKRLAELDAMESKVDSIDMGDVMFACDVANQPG